MVSHVSLEEFVLAADALGEVRYVNGADRDLEVGCLTELVAERRGPMLVFDEFAGFPAGYRVCTNVMQSTRRFALAMDLPLDAHPVELVRLWREKQKALRNPVLPKIVADGPVLEHRQEGDDVDLGAFPTPMWHEGDGGRYIGTADLVVTRDPDGGWVNVGTYRAQIQSGNRVSLWIIAAKHGRMIVERYWRRGQAAPVAIVLGCDPLTWMVGGMSAPFGVSEYEYASAFRGAPLELVALPSTGLPVPAEAEIVLEGEIPPLNEESAHEGPFGEWPGYYSHEGMECVVRVTRVHHRSRPILLGAPPLRPIVAYTGNAVSAIPPFTVQLWEHLERSGVTDVTGVWGFGNTLMLVVSLRQRYAGHAKQALLSMAGFRAGGSAYRYFLVVDDDIDTSNLEEVMWAMCTRVDPSVDVDVVRGGWTADLDPRLSPDQRETGDLTMGRLLINACKPFTWRDRFPATNAFAAHRRTEVADRWQGLLNNLAGPGRSVWSAN